MPRPAETIARRAACLLALAVALAGTAAAQAPGGAASVFVDVRTNLPGAVLWADSARLGPVDGPGWRAVPVRTKTLRLTAPEATSWSIAPLAYALAAAPGDSVTATMPFPYYYAVQSVPYGAAVFVVDASGRRRLGTTPLVHVQDEPVGGTLVVERPEYAPVTLTPEPGVWNRFDLVLDPTAPTPETAHEMKWRPPSRGMTWIDYAALGTALAAGVATVHYKFKADRLYDDYAATTDPSLRPDIDVYDTRAAVALGVMQAGVGVFALRLVLR